MKPIFYIAANTFKDAIRQKLILLTSLIALVLVASSKYFLSLDMGHERLRFVFDFGSGAISFFGSIIAIVATCQLFHSEIENKTIITLLSKPVRISGFVAGKILGVAAVLGLFVAIITIATAIMLAFTYASFGDAAMRLSSGLTINYWGIAACAFIQWLKLMVIATVAAFICSASRSLLFSVVVTFMCITISLMGSATTFMGGKDSVFSMIVSYIFPDLQMFSAAETFAFAPINVLTLGASLGYAVIYIAVLGALSSWLFSRREF